jgi:hypothetical protein
LLATLLDALQALSDTARAGQLSDEQLGQLLQHLLFEYKLPDRLTALLAWLQQRPESLLLQQQQVEAAQAGQLPSIVGAWMLCLARLTGLVELQCGRGSSRSAAAGAERLTQALEATGESSGSVTRAQYRFTTKAQQLS